MKKTTLSIMILSFGLILSCSYFQARLGIKDCKFKFKKYDLKGISLKSIKGDVVLNIENPNKTEVIIERTEYEFGFDKKKLLNGTTKKTINIPPKKDVNVTITTKISNKNTVKTALNMMFDEVKTVYIAGKVYVSVAGVEVFPVSFKVTKKVDSKALKKKAAKALAKGATKANKNKLKKKLKKLF